MLSFYYFVNIFMFWLSWENAVKVIPTLTL